MKEFEDDGLVRRHEYLEVPVRVEYEVTDAARALKPILTELAKWGSSLKNARATC
ncbi:MAG: winged helix-turn-helix transcriptional regulator [Clostridia bacterium]|nr:winged helix-turn-helix transcriptional regulator [Clostridia bacterium]